MAPRDVNVDHDEIATKTRQMEGVLTDLRGLRTGLEGIVENMTKEASVATSGGPAPIFGPLLNASSEAVKRLQKSLDAVEYRVQADLDILNAMSNEVKQVSEDAARSIESTDSAFDRGSGGSGGSASTSSSSDTTVNKSGS